ncbi:unnamed protein product [Brassica napus]|uniref:(rape) hypothetical protein n=1 Tax=Brassica napus TaxID=3708 RepID=A0A816QFN7_BRANA|nr:unnamed protein product [Brassica napus]
MEQALLNLLPQCFVNRGLEAGEVENFFVVLLTVFHIIVEKEKSREIRNIVGFVRLRCISFFFHFGCIYIHIFLLLK